MTLSKHEEKELEQVRDYLKHHPEAVDRLLTHVTDAARPVAKKNLDTFLDYSMEPNEIKKELDAVRSRVSEEILHELDYLREIIAVRAHFYLGQLSEEEADELKKAREYLQKHPDTVEKLVHEVAPVAHDAAKRNLAAFLNDDAAPEAIKKELGDIRLHASTEVLKELDHLRAIIFQYAHVFFHRGLTPQEADELVKARDYLQNHPDAVDKLVHKVAAEAQPFAKKNLEVFLDAKKAPHQIKKEIDEVRAKVSPEVLTELDHLRDIIGEHAHAAFGTKH